MNEGLIKKLANNAGCNYLYDYDADGHAMVCSLKDIQNLVKLVVQECATLAYDGPNGILEHFGVEPDQEWKYGPGVNYRPTLPTEE